MKNKECTYNIIYQIFSTHMDGQYICMWLKLTKSLNGIVKRSLSEQLTQQKILKSTSLQKLFRQDFDYA